MQFSSTLFALVAIATVSVAALPQTESSSQGSCSTGTAQCCESVHDGADAQSLASLIGLNDVVGQVGLNCNQIPVNVVGASAAVSNSCKNTAVCCTGNESNGLIQTSCTPLSVN